VAAILQVAAIFFFGCAGGLFGRTAGN